MQHIRLVLHDQRHIAVRFPQETSLCLAKVISLLTEQAVCFPLGGSALLMRTEMPLSQFWCFSHCSTLTENGCKFYELCTFSHICGILKNSNQCRDNILALTCLILWSLSNNFSLFFFQFCDSKRKGISTSKKVFYCELFCPRLFIVMAFYSLIWNYRHMEYSLICSIKILQTSEPT